MAELTAPLVLKNEEKRIVYGPVLIPDEPDTDNDVVTAEQIESVAHKFVEDYGNIDLLHTLNNVGKLVESYISPVDLSVDKDTTIPKGSWIMGVRVTDDDSWEAVKNGSLGGFSIMAIQKTALKSSKKSEEFKRVTLADLGDDWIVNAVSLVDEPAVPKAKFLAIKSKKDINSNVDMNDTIKKAIAGSLEHRKSLLVQKLEDLFGGEDRYPNIHSTLDDSVIFRIYDVTGKRKTFQVPYEIAENGSVNFLEEPKEVLIEEQVVPVEKMKNLLGAEKFKDVPKESDGIVTRFIKGLGFGKKTSEQKQGQKGDEKMKKEDVQKLIDESMETVESKLDDVLKTIKAEAGDGGADEENQTEETDEKAEKSKGKESDVTSQKGKKDEEDYKEKYEQVIKELDKVQAVPFSNRLAGQDIEGAEKSKEAIKDDRNAFGFKI